MKEFFEEYGKVIVTVLVILGIILIGYVIAGNGQNSALGKFTTATVDSLTGQANSVLESNIQGWNASNPNSQYAVLWSDDVEAHTIENLKTSDMIDVKNLNEDSPVPGMIRKVSLKRDSQYVCGSFSYISVKGKDGAVSDRLEPGKRYKMLFYARGNGTWFLGPEQAPHMTYSLTEKWHKISYTFTAADGLHAFVQYKPNGGRYGEWCEVTGLLISEVK